MNATETPTVETLPDDLDELTKDELRAVADGADLDVPRKAPKAVLVEAVGQHRDRVREIVERSLAETEPEEEIEGDVVDETDEAIESTALALREEPPAAVPALLPTTAEFDAMLAIAGRIASTQIVPTAYRGKPDDVLAAILTGREMGLGPMQSTRDIYVIEGKPTFAAHLLLARMRQGGLIIEESESTKERAWIRARRRDTGERAEVEWTIEEAREATTREKGQTIKLAEKTNWRNYPADMLWARAVGRLARRIGADLIGAVMPYTSEEVQDWDEAEADSGGDVTGGYGSDRRTGQWVAPKDWRELAERFRGALGEDASAWMEELAEKGYKLGSIGAIVAAPEAEVPGDRKRDLWQRLGRVLRAIEEVDAPNGIAFLDDPRSEIQRAFYNAFDGVVAIVGPEWALSGAEAEKGMKQRHEVLGTPEPEKPSPAAEATGGSDPPSETPEAARTAEDAPGTAPGDVVDGAGDPIKF